MYYFKEEKDVTPLGCISLVGASISAHKSKKNTFVIKHSGNETDVLTADSPEDYQAWMACISERISKSPPLIRKSAFKILDQISPANEDIKAPAPVNTKIFCSFFVEINHSNFIRLSLKKDQKKEIWM